jgi:hypothetical protein
MEYLRRKREVMRDLLWTYMGIRKEQMRIMEYVQTICVDI